MASNNFTIIIPTYTGVKTINKCFESILKQKLKIGYEIIIVIDGPSPELLSLCNNFIKIITVQEIRVRVVQLNKNGGRFLARLEGANAAKTQKLLFLDDRISFGQEYLSLVTKLSKQVLIPSVNEAKAENLISRCLFILRKKVYGRKKFGQERESYYINKKNFEKTPKGTTSLWIDKGIFLTACGEIKQEASENRYINEDTKLFKAIINNGHKIYRSSEATILYEPRSGTVEELKHIYHRGPRFVDYYISPKTRFFPLLVSSLLAGVLCILGIILQPTILLSALLAGFALLVIFALFSAEQYSDFPVLLVGLPVIFVFFSLGVYKGVIVWLMNIVSRSNEAK